MRIMCDVSSHQGEINFNVMKSAGAEGVAIRATIGALYTDPMFYVNWEAAGKAGLARTAYHVMKPGQKVQDQMNRFKNVVGKRKPDFKRIGWVNDCELIDGCTAAQISPVIWGLNCELSGHVGVECLIYTRFSYWNSATSPSPKWTQWELWVARYTNAPAPWCANDPPYFRPRVLEWDDWAVWQWSADGNRQGPLYGAGSRDIDLNRAKDWIFEGVGKPDPEPEPEPEPVVIHLPHIVAGEYKKIN